MISASLTMHLRLLEGCMPDFEEVAAVCFPLLDAVRREHCVRALVVEVEEDDIRILQRFADGETVVLF